jgi:hypothetical protein
MTAHEASGGVARSHGAITASEWAIAPDASSAHADASELQFARLRARRCAAKGFGSRRDHARACNAATGHADAYVAMAVVRQALSKPSGNAS